MIETALLGLNTVLILTAALAATDLLRFAVRKHRRAQQRTEYRTQS